MRREGLTGPTGLRAKLISRSPFRLYGVYKMVEWCEVHLDADVLSLEGITANINLDHKLLGKKDVDSAIEGLLGNQPPLRSIPFDLGGT